MDALLEGEISSSDDFEQPETKIKLFMRTFAIEKQCVASSYPSRSDESAGMHTDQFLKSSKFQH